MKRYKKVLLGDIWFWAALATLVTALATGAALTPQDWPAMKVVILVGVVVGFWLMGLAAVLNTIRRKPDFEVCLSGGRSLVVWTDGIKEVEPGLIRAAITHFIRTVSTTTTFTLDQLEDMLDGSGIEFRKGLLTWRGLGFVMEGKEGLQKGKWMAVHWRGSIKDSAFFHELCHMLDEVVRNHYDPKHEDSLLWGLEHQLNKTFQS